MVKMTREQLARMSDDELLAYGRERHGDPYMTLADAKALRKMSLKFWHMGARDDGERAEREAAAEASTPTRPVWMIGAVDHSPRW
jgi:hypothetical protein